jgi:hypothetical protein
VEAGAYLQQAGDAAFDLDPPDGGAVTRERILSRVLLPAPLRPMPVLSTSTALSVNSAEGNADDLPALHLEGDVLERPEERVISFQFTVFSGRARLTTEN